MSYLKLIAAGLSFTSEVLGHINDKKARKYQEQLVTLQLLIAKEEAKGYHCDDSKLTEWYEELTIITKAAQFEMRLQLAKKK